ncbi:Flp pilus assembly complex ATPase component TadA [Patescibacteria group bacterium AH-259-L07]|nr:Flp pilus assembly complex ATPase component TadA [Patescibacteria group bacterium AH-259-L07]
MVRYNTLKQRPKHFTSFTGLTVQEFNTLVARLRDGWRTQRIERLNKNNPDRQRKIGAGRKKILSALEDQLLVALVWAKLYTSYRILEYLFGIDESTVYRTIRETTPFLQDISILPKPRKGKKITTLEGLRNILPALDTILADTATAEEKLLRPQTKRKRKQYHPGEKESVTVKTQIAVKGQEPIVPISRASPGRKPADRVFIEPSLPEVIPQEAPAHQNKGYQEVSKAAPDVPAPVLPKRTRSREELAREKLHKLVVRPGHISEADFDLSVSEAKKKNKEAADVLIQKGLIKDEQLGRLLAEEGGYPFINLRKEKIDEKMLTLIPELVARSRGVIAFERGKKGIKIGMLDPTDLEMRHFIEKRTGENVVPYFITKQDLGEALFKYKPSLEEEFGDILKTLKDKSLSRVERDEATVKMVDALLMYGYQNNASDIHIEPYTKKVMVRFRIDGVMHDVLEIPKSLLDFIITRIKILSRMRTDEHRAAQDGKFRFGIKEGAVDIRVSVVPVTEGENVVMRILSARGRRFNLTDLGFSARDLKKIQRAIRRPHGMILVTGPTGSGKTTTLYAILKILNIRDVHISTIEDPVEYDVEGVSQIQVNPKTNLTFAKGLRAIVRQDPDIIMVGEIRDRETAGIAVNSALTGHLVLSTLHTNDAATTLPRLLDMKVEPFLVVSTVNVAIAQRLVRKVCEKCRASYKLTREEKISISGEPTVMNILTEMGYVDLDKITLFRGGGCKACAGNGYAGRIGIYEVLEMEENIRELILKRVSSAEIMKAAITNGMTTMLYNGIEKVFRGITTIEEVLRVTRE